MARLVTEGAWCRFGGRAAAGDGHLDLQDLWQAHREQGGLGFLRVPCCPSDQPGQFDRVCARIFRVGRLPRTACAAACAVSLASVQLAVSERGRPRTARVCRRRTRWHWPSPAPLLPHDGAATLTQPGVQVRILILGLDNAGKTTILYRLHQVHLCARSRTRICTQKIVAACAGHKRRAIESERNNA